MEKRRLHAYTGGFLRDQRIKRILELSGYEISLGLPERRAGLVAIWGHRPRNWRGKRIATWREVGTLNVEDGFLRSIHTGRAGEAPQSVALDKTGVYFDCSAPSDLENLLNYAELSSGALTDRANAGIEHLQQTGLSKYNGFDPTLDVGEKDYVLVIDQTRDDASITFGGANADSFTKMLNAARQENPDKLILIKTHPEVVSRYRRGHFNQSDLDENMRLLREPFVPQHLLSRATKVYCVTSLMGFEAILAGHKPRVFGRPFYGGWGLSEDEKIFERRERVLTRPQLFAATMLLYPKYFDVYRDTLCEFETVVDNLEAQARAWSEDCQGYGALGIRLWKRRHFRGFFAGAGGLLSFQKEVSSVTNSARRGLIWASKETEQVREAFAKTDHPLLRLEDGFLRSNGLGAELVPPMSLVVDDLGIYYDPSHESQLERLLNASDALDHGQIKRAQNLRERLISNGVSKYNTGRNANDEGWPDGKRILVPGQVEDDASILRGTTDICQNLDLLIRVRADNPGDFIVYKPHPDVQAGLRKGLVRDSEILKYADTILHDTDAIAAINLCDQVCTMTSLLGFEALLRSKKVTCYGTPFYAGWSLTQDLGATVDRRVARPSLDALVHAALIAYPRYFDPTSGLACPVEVMVDRLEKGAGVGTGPSNRILSKLQGIFASFAPLWR